MDWESILKLVAVVAGLGATAVALAKHFSNQQKAVSQLRAELKELKTQTKVLRQPLAQGGPPGTANVYQQLLAASTEAQEALAADLHSISVPVPPADPT